MKDLSQITYGQFKAAEPHTLHGPVPADTALLRTWADRAPVALLARFLATHHWYAAAPLWRRWASLCSGVGPDPDPNLAAVLLGSESIGGLRLLQTELRRSELDYDIRELRLACVRLVYGVVADVFDARLTPQFILEYATAARVLPEVETAFRRCIKEG